MLNVLSVDVEDYFHVEAFAAQIPSHSWSTFEPRVDRNIAQVLEIFGSHETKATFFILGWVAERFPRIVREIAAAGHEVGCHGSAHRRIHTQTPEQFRNDIRTARQQLMDQLQKPVDCYRAPSFSVVNETLWAMDILAEEGFRIDSSVFPVRHDLYGIPNAQRTPHWRNTPQGNSIFEFPPSTIRRMRNNVGVGGGGYLRFAPYGLTRWALRQINNVERQPAMVYFHPWELDPKQPRINAPLRSRVRHYTNLAGMRAKIEHLLTDFRFSTISEVCSQLPAYQARGGKPDTAPGDPLLE
jgi:polysaccharide deacetylase family protein (PEP-CTERM system associated)